MLYSAVATRSSDVYANVVVPQPRKVRWVLILRETRGTWKVAERREVRQCGMLRDQSELRLTV